MYKSFKPKTLSILSILFIGASISYGQVTNVLQGSKVETLPRRTVTSGDAPVIELKEKIENEQTIVAPEAMNEEIYEVSETIESNSVQEEIIIEVPSELDSKIDLKEKNKEIAEVPLQPSESKVQAISRIAPSKFFDLSDWSLSVPTDKNKDGKADQVKERELNGNYSNEYFYATEDKGMVFKCPIGGFKTSSNTSYTRSELREMLRAGDYNIKTKGVTKNNWVLASAPHAHKAGGYNAQLKATLAVNKVTTTGDPKQVGRVIIGQIHAEHNEPLRIYYRKLPGNEKGSIYFAHEGRDNDKEDYYELIGSKSSSADNPADGIALDEKFSYQVNVIDNTLNVKIMRPNKPVAQKTIDIKKSGYNAKEEYMYFKAGVYNQNKTGDKEDFVQATFYSLENKHQVLR